MSPSTKRLHCIRPAVPPLPAPRPRPHPRRPRPPRPHHHDHGDQTRGHHASHHHDHGDHDAADSPGGTGRPGRRIRGRTRHRGRRLRHARLPDPLGGGHPGDYRAGGGERAVGSRGRGAQPAQGRGPARGRGNRRSRYERTHHDNGLRRHDERVVGSFTRRVRQHPRGPSVAGPQQCRAGPGRRQLPTGGDCRLGHPRRQNPEWFGSDGTHLAIDGPGAQALASLITTTLSNG